MCVLSYGMCRSGRWRGTTRRLDGRRKMTADAPGPAIYWEISHLSGSHKLSSVYQRFKEIIFSFVRHACGAFSSLCGVQRQNHLYPVRQLSQRSTRASSSDANWRG